MRPLQCLQRIRTHVGKTSDSVINVLFFKSQLNQRSLRRFASLQLYTSLEWVFVTVIPKSQVSLTDLKSAHLIPVSRPRGVITNEISFRGHIQYASKTAVHFVRSIITYQCRGWFSMTAFRSFHFHAFQVRISQRKSSTHGTPNKNVRRTINDRRNGTIAVHGILWDIG